jgi:hypothetical protein
MRQVELQDLSGAYDMNNIETASSIMLQIGPLPIGNTVVTTWV